jgi:hypothetical protein
MRKLIANTGKLLFATLLCLSMVAVQAEDATFSEAELDQMMAPIALYPDALLAQILMAATYPADVAEAVIWSKDHPDLDGDAAVEAVQDKSWDPSVMSLVAFPQVLAMAGEQPDWVQDMGDAFLADSEAVMDTVQKLRNKAREEGNLETTEQQKVIIEEPSSSETVVIIEPADPQVVYVPSYNPTVVYGTWWWPHYTPWYYRPVGYGFGSAVVRGIGFGIGVGITNALWGGCHWGRGHGSIDINVNRYNNININRNKLDVNKKTTNWTHNSNNRRGVPYRDEKSRQKFENKRAGANQREDFRGRDAQRDKALATLDKRGVDPAEGRKALKGAGGDKTRDLVSKANRDVAQGKLGKLDTRDAGKAREAARNIDRDKAKSSLQGLDREKAKSNLQSRDAGKTREAARNIDRDKAKSGLQGMDREKAKSSLQSRDTGKMRDRSGTQAFARNNALRGAGNAQKTRQDINRGQSSNRSMKSFGGGGRGGGGRAAGRR